MNTIRQLEMQLESTVKVFKLSTLRLRQTITTKKACEDSGYLPYYPSFNSSISTLINDKRRLKSRIRLIAKELRDHRNFERS